MIINKRALWLAVNSEFGERLVQIAQEHSSLTRDLTLNSGLSDQDRKFYTFRIGQLREERETILKQFDGGVKYEVLSY